MTTAASTPVPPPGAVPVYEVEPPGEPKPQKVDYLVVFGHSNFLYWWPVWLVSFILAGITYFEGNQLAVVPEKTQHIRNAEIPDFAGPRDALIAPEGKSIPLAPGEDGKPDYQSMTVSSSNNLGAIFIGTLLLVAVVSTLLLRGLVSLVVIMGFIAVTVILALLGLWDNIFLFLGGLDIRMNAAGYLAVGIPLFLIWMFVVFVYDRQQYFVFDQGQIRYVRDIGDGETVIDASGALVEKKRNDVFRHWLLGLGTGDLLVRTGGSNGRTIELENVVNANRKLEIINRLIREKAITME